MDGLLKVMYLEAGGGAGGSARSLTACIERLKSRGFRPLVYLLNPAADSTIFKNAEIPVIKTKSNRSPFPDSGPLAGFRFLRRLYSGLLPESRAISTAVKRGGFRIIHGNNDISSNMAGILAARMAGVHYVQHLRTTRTPTRSERLFASRVSRFVTVSAYGAELLGKSFPQAGKIEVIRNIITAPPMESMPAPLPDVDMNSQVRFGIFSNLVKGKGHEAFLTAAEKVREKIPSARFYIFGGGVSGHENYREEIIRRIDEFKPAGAVKYMGFQNDIFRYMAAMDAVVETSELPEGLQRTLVEAAMLGKTIICSDSGGAREIIENSATGFLFKPGDADELAERMLEAAASQELRARLGDAARKLANRLFSPDASADALMGLYRSITE